MIVETIQFIVATPVKGNDGVGVADVQIDALRESVTRATEGLAAAFQGLREVGGFELSELSIGLEIGAEGGVTFIGTSKISGGASVTMKFVPPNPRTKLTS